MSVTVKAKGHDIITITTKLNGSAMNTERWTVPVGGIYQVTTGSGVTTSNVAMIHSTASTGVNNPILLNTYYLVTMDNDVKKFTTLLHMLQYPYLYGGIKNLEHLTNPLEIEAAKLLYERQ